MLLVSVTMKLLETTELLNLKSNTGLADSVTQNSFKVNDFKLNASSNMSLMLDS